MRTLATTALAALILTGCNTLRGTGKDVELLGETLTGGGHRTAELVTGEDARMTGQPRYNNATGQYRASDDRYQVRDDDFQALQRYQDPPRRQDQQRGQAQYQQQQQWQADSPQRQIDDRQIADPGADLQWRRIEEPQQAMPRQQLVSASDLMALDLVSPQGRYLGHLEQITFDTQTGQVTYAIVNVGQDRYVVPINALERRSEALILYEGPGQRQAMQQQQMHQQQQQQQFGQQAGQMQQQGQQIGGMRQASTQDLFGMQLSNDDGDQLGQIEDVVLDLDRGRAAFLLLSIDDQPDQMAAVPFDALQVRQRVITRAVVPTDRDTIDQLTFREGQRPYEDPLFAQRVQQQFRDRPDPQFQVFAFPGGGPDEIDTEELQTIRGRIVNVGTFRDDTGEADGLRVRVRTSDGDLVTVHAGPRDYARRQGITLQPGQEVVIRGARTEHNGRDLFVASEIYKGETLHLRDEQGRPRWMTDRFGGRQPGETRDQQQRDQQQQQQQRPDDDDARDNDREQNDPLFR